MERLATPARRCSLTDLPAIWFCQSILVQLKMRPVSHELPTSALSNSALSNSGPSSSLLHRLRGAFGEGLKRGASAEAIAGQPCPFDPPCALDVFFREQLRIDGRHGVPKPYVLAMGTWPGGLTFRLTVFGFACDWFAAVREVFIEAVQDRIWQPSSPPRRIAHVSYETVDADQLEALGPVPPCVELDFLSPFDVRGEDPLNDPASLIGRLARRIDGMVRWMDAELDVDWAALSNHWRGLDAHFIEADPITTRRFSRRQNREIVNETALGRLALSGDLRPIWPLLVLGQYTHVGRGAVSGYGLYRLDLMD